jgi:hypothetical protein
VRAEIELPSGYVPTDIAPDDGTFAAPGGSRLHVTKTSADGKCVVTEQFQALPAIVNPADYLKLMNVESTLGRKSETTFLLEKK